LTTGTSDQLAAVAAIGSTLGTINGEISLQSANLAALAGATGAPSLFGQTLVATVGSAGALAAAVNAASYVGRIGTNIDA
jgi:hypothetical protein